jgi:hypothetical protein
MHRLRGDFASVLMAGARGELAGARLEWDPGPSVCVVLASGGYPGAYARRQTDHGHPGCGKGRLYGLPRGNAHRPVRARDGRRPGAGRHGVRRQPGRPFVHLHCHTDYSLLDGACESAS